MCLIQDFQGLSALEENISALFFTIVLFCEAALQYYIQCSFDQNGIFHLLMLNKGLLELPSLIKQRSNVITSDRAIY